MRRSTTLAALLCLAAVPAVASGNLQFGSKSGEQVTVKGVYGIGTAHAVIAVAYTEEDARKYCEDQRNDPSKACIEQAMRETYLNDKLVGNCITGRFVTIGGESLRFYGEDKARKNEGPRYIILRGNTMLDATTASNYFASLEQFEALCPGRAYGDE